MESVTGHLIEHTKLMTFLDDLVDSLIGKQNGMQDISLLILCIH